MENIIMAFFNAAHGRVVVQEVLEYAFGPKWIGEARICRFRATNGMEYIAPLDEIELVRGAKLQVTTN